MSARILIVDDSLTVRMDLADAFIAAGFSPLPCASVAEARALLEREQVDVAILDVVLPDGVLASYPSCHAALKRAFGYGVPSARSGGS